MATKNRAWEDQPRKEHVRFSV